MFKNKWFIHSEPKFYLPKPQKQTVINRFVRFHVGNNFDNDYKISDIIEMLPKNKKVEDIVIRADHNHYESDCESSIEFGFYDTEVRENKGYERELKAYNKALQNHEEEVKEWKLWKEKEEERILDAEIKRAQSFLKKHGRL